MAKTNFNATWEDLGIDYSDWQSDPQAFAKRVAAKARELATELEKPNSIVNVETSFKSKALANTELAVASEEIIAMFLSTLSQCEPEVLVNVMARLPQVTEYCHKIVRTTAMRKTRAFSKKRTHAMYVKLRKMYETFCEFQKSFYPETAKGFPFIPAKSGNYSEATGSGIKEYIFKIGDDEFLNYYTAARILGIEISTYMDLVDFFTQNKTHNGLELSFIEVGADK